MLFKSHPNRLALLPWTWQQKHQHRICQNNTPVLRICASNYTKLFNAIAAINSSVGGMTFSCSRQELETLVENFLAAWKKVRVKPSLKPHLIAAHLTDFVFNHNLSLGIAGEQAIESCHAVFNRVSGKGSASKLERFASRVKKMAIYSFPWITCTILYMLLSALGDCNNVHITH